MRRLITMLCALSCVGCVPWIIQKTPTVNGRVERSGQPVSNAEVSFIPAEWPPAKCRRSDLVTMTDASGAFSIEGKRGLGVIPLMGDMYASLTLCIYSEGNWYEGYGKLYFPNAVPSSVFLHCDLSKQRSKDYVCMEQPVEQLLK